MAWRAVYRTSDGKLLSVGSVWTVPPKAGTDFIALADRPPDDEMWDKATTAFVPRPPKVLLDRFDDDLLTHPKYAQFRDVYDSLSNPDKAKVRNAIRQILGAELKRSEAEDDEIGGNV